MFKILVSHKNRTIVMTVDTEDEVEKTVDKIIKKLLKDEGSTLSVDEARADFDVTVIKRGK